jgi:hypothetical protein
VREGLHSASFADSYRTYVAMHDKSDEDPLIADIRQRLGQ